ncbi:MAG: PAS domain S-box protein [Desulfobacteraceae bacterium]|nr:PAS domain S-box protein [Desulfobacteraceae bacterium]
MTAKPAYEELEQELKTHRQEAEKYRQLIENLNEVLYMLDLDARVTYVSPNIKNIAGYSPEEIIGRNFIDFVHPEDLENRMHYFMRVLSGEGITTEYRYLTKSGRTKWVMTNARPVLKGDEVVGIQGMLVDITDRKNMEENYRKSEERYRNILESIEDGYYEVDADGRILFFNNSLCRMLGYTSRELWGMNAKDLMDEENSRKMMKTAARVYNTDKSYKAFDWELIRKDGAICHVEASISLNRNPEGQPSKLYGIARDITERKKNEEEKENLRSQLRRSQQMEAIGTLAGGIAHDFNNILSSVIGYAELSMVDTQKETRIHENLSRILAAGNRAKDLVRQILTLARDGNEEFTPVSVVPMIKESMKLLRSTLPATIRLQEKINDNGSLIVNANPTQLHQIIVNLATNAKYAMGDNHGTLEIRVEPVSFDNSAAKQYTEQKPGDYIKLAVSDTGTGIPPEIRHKIFSPYFTTKERGVGTGLGLSLVHGIVKKHKGHINVYSELGKGTSIQVFLPLAKASELPEQREQEDKSLPPGKESILLVDDEQFITELEKEYLERMGYRVTARTSSVEALEAYRAMPQKFDLLITDMTMPNMTGDILAREIKSIRPDIPVILCTGFSESINGDGGNSDIDAFLMKPVTRAKMANTVRSVLDDAETTKSL